MFLPCQQSNIVALLHLEALPDRVVLVGRRAAVRGFVAAVVTLWAVFSLRLGLLLDQFSFASLPICFCQGSRCPRRRGTFRTGRAAPDFVWLLRFVNTVIAVFGCFCVRVRKFNHTSVRGLVKTRRRVIAIEQSNMINVVGQLFQGESLELRCLLEEVVVVKSPDRAVCVQDLAFRPLFLVKLTQIPE